MMFLALALAAAAQAKPAHPTAAKPAAARSTIAKPAKTIGPSTSGPQATVKLSPAGQEVLKKYIGQPDPDFVALATQLRETGAKVAGLSDAPQLDMAELEQLMRKQEELQAAMRKRSNDRLLAMLNEMSPEDRITFARGTVSMGPQAKGAPSR